MDDGEEDLSDRYLLPNPEMAQSFEEFLKNSRTCTHTHTCNPPGPAAAVHTHTCHHTHTQVFAAGAEEMIGEDDEIKKSSRKPLGNREAVRKYREKKKAHAAFLEEEIKTLQIVNQQLLGKLQGQAALEAEAVRLRSLLVDLRGKLDAELGSFPIQNQCRLPGLQYDSNGHCYIGDAEITDWEASCVPLNIDCHSNQDEGIGSQKNSIVSSTSQTG